MNYTDADEDSEKLMTFLDEVAPANCFSSRWLIMIGCRRKKHLDRTERMNVMMMNG